MSFLITLSAVAVMLLYAVPGFLLIKTKLIKDDHIPSFSKVLLYVCQPALAIYSFRQVTLSRQSLIDLSVCFAITLGLQLGMLLLYFVLFRRKRNDIVWRIVNLASVLSNCAFLGIPILEALLPDHPEALAYSSIFGVTMNLLGWSVGMYIISLDKRYIKPKKMFLNPGSVGFFIALVMYLFSFQLPEQIESMLTLLGRMSTPLCMMILGMRLATVKIKDIFCDWRQYLAVVLNQVIYPLIAFGLMLFLPISPVLKASIFILCSCPVASMVQNYAELIGQGNDKGANTVLLGTLLSILTVPTMCLLI